MKMIKLILVVGISPMPIFTGSLYAQVRGPVKAEPAKPAEQAAAPRKTLWFEGYGIYSATPFGGAWNTDPSINTNAINQPAAATVRTYIPGEAATGFGGGLNVGYEFLDGLSGVLGFQLIGQSSTTKEIRVDNGGTFDVTRTTKTSLTTTSVNLGIRPEKKFGNFSIYGGGGLLVMLPFTVTTDEQTPGETVTGARTSRLTKDKYNLALGGYAEIGAKYHIGAVAVGLGMRLNMASTSNNGNTKVTTDTRVNNAGTTTTTTIKDSFSAADRTAEQAKNAGTNNYDLASPTSVLLNNWQITLSASYAIGI
ncbi:MAG: hypothetical protein ACOY5B_13820 [Spirochaetota bacterium]